MYNIVNDNEKWCNEWKQQGWISTYFLDNRYIAFRTDALDELFPTTKADKTDVHGWVCYYCFERFPGPTQAFLHFHAERFDKDTSIRYKKVNCNAFRKNNRTDWRFHRLQSWNIEKYQKDDLKSTLEYIILDVIPKFEKQVKTILERE